MRRISLFFFRPLSLFEVDYCVLSDRHMARVVTPEEKKWLLAGGGGSLLLVVRTLHRASGGTSLIPCTPGAQFDCTSENPAKFSTEF